MRENAPDGEFVPAFVVLDNATGAVLAIAVALLPHRDEVRAKNGGVLPENPKQLASAYKKAGLLTVNGTSVSRTSNIGPLLLALTSFWRSPIRDRTVIKLRKTSACISATMDRAFSSSALLAGGQSGGRGRAGRVTPTTL